MMNTYKKIFLFFVVLVEVILTGFLLYRYYLSTKKPPVVTVLNKENIEINTDSELKNFYELKPNITEKDKPEWLEEEAVYTYNNDGLNDRFDYEVEKPANTFRIIALGDSFTFGQFLSTKYSWPELLEDDLNNKLCDGLKFEVLNLGVGGYDIAYITEAYKRKGQKYNPDLIIWFENNSGFFRNKELEEPLVKECTRGSSDIEENVFAWSECFVEANKQLDKKYGWQNIAELNNSWFDKFFELAPMDKVVFFGFEESSLSEESSKALKLRLSKYPEMDFRQVIPDIRKLDGILYDGHPNKDGQIMIEREIFNSIKNDISCNLNN